MNGGQLGQSKADTICTIFAAGDPNFKFTIVKKHDRPYIQASTVKRIAFYG